MHKYYIMVKYLVMIGLIYLSSGVLAQHYNRIDSLNSHLQQTAGKDQVSTLYEIAWEFRNSYPDSTIFYASKALSLADSLNEDLMKAQSYNLTGIAYSYKGNYVQAFDNLQMGLNVSMSYHDSLQMGHALNTLGRLFLSQGDLIKAYNYFQQAKTLFIEIDDRRGLSYVLKSMAEIYVSQSNLPKALETLEKVLIIRKDIEDYRGQISVYNELANIYTTLGDWEKAFINLSDAQQIADEIGDHVSTAEIDLAISKIYYQQDNYEQSLQYLSKAQEAIESIENDDLWARLLLQKGSTLISANSGQKSKEIVEEAYQLSIKSGRKDISMRACQHLYELALANNEYEKALNYFTKYHEFSQELQDADKSREIAKLESRLLLDQKEKENDLLKAENAIDEANLKQREFEMAMLVIVTVVIMLFAIILLFFARKMKIKNRTLKKQKDRINQQREEIAIQNTKINEQNKGLHLRNEELAKLNEEKDNLMKIMAHDLKSPFNRIVSLIDLLNITEPASPDYQQYLSLIKKASRSGVDLIRDILDVYAYGMDDKNVKEEPVDIIRLFEKLVDNYSNDIKLKSLKVQIDPEKNKSLFFSDDRYLERILDNLLSNAIKFSPAGSTIRLKSYVRNKCMFITLRDEGPGFSEEDKKLLYHKFKRLSAQPTGGESSNGLGLAIVKILVSQLNGKIELKSEQNKGSEFILQFDLKSENQPVQP